MNEFIQSLVYQMPAVAVLLVVLGANLKQLNKKEERIDRVYSKLEEYNSAYIKMQKELGDTRVELERAMGKITLLENTINGYHNNS